MASITSRERFRLLTEREAGHPEGSPEKEIKESQVYLKAVDNQWVIPSYTLERNEEGEKEMPTHSLDLRQRVVAAYQAGQTSIRQVAKWFMVTKRTIHRWVRQYQQTQNLTPKKVGTKQVGILEQHRQEVMAIIAEQPNFYL